MSEPTSIINVESIKKAPIKQLFDAHCSHNVGHSAYEHWTKDDVLLVEEVLHEADRAMAHYYPDTAETVLEVIGGAGFAYAQKVAKFRSGLQEPSRAWSPSNDSAEAD